MIMKNAFDTPVKIDMWYDLKGSLHNWETIGNNTTIAKKDLNFIEDKIQLNLKETSKNYLINLVKADCDFFSENNILDYSLLVGIHKVHDKENIDLVDQKDSVFLLSNDKKEIYFLSIIDFLTVFDFRKKTEHLILGMVYGNKISAIPPK